MDLYFMPLFIKEIAKFSHLVAEIYINFDIEQSGG